MSFCKKYIAEYEVTAIVLLQFKLAEYDVSQHLE